MSLAMQQPSLPASAGEVAAVAARHAAESEEARGPHPEVVKRLAAAGFLRHMVPAAWGGRAGGFSELLDAVLPVGEACAASAWCASLFAASSRIVSFFPEEGQREVWAEGPDVAVVSSVTPFGEAERVPEGWRVRGRWPYMSAVEHAEWAVVCAKTAPEDGSAEPGLRLFLLPRSAFAVEDTWQSVGMRGTGSHTVVVDGLTVPERLSCERARVFEGRVSEGVAREGRVAPLPAVNGLTFVVPALGAARGARAAFAAYLAGKLRNAPRLPGVPGVAGNQVSHELALARSDAEVDAAELLLRRIADLADGDGEFTPCEVARNVRDTAYAVDLLVSAVNRMFRAAGTSGQRPGAPLERHWRDVNSVATHQALQPEPAARLYAAAALG
ncbi:acyl-CoA dehydrogenase family protein [Streptomyces sp. DSM 44917]|uniref:Acyl-CoA dehydrogenase family protein n=1 Tax=Streptomyces boetiae TaxID=3075541 RepID=A0ABU2L4Z6_9ACTN|nr:acyl-CoA dehydrogenase family protein [Streptomyces sp. DSM 44917]MDT0306491.1 acyl-CoA dehydrogenase family protein [Streptomyces sp. DSM 44917]